MIEIIPFEDVKPGDILLIDGIDDDHVRVITVESVEEDCIVPVDFFEYYPPDPEQIVRIGYMSRSQGTTIVIDSYFVDTFVKEKPEIG